MEKQEIEKVVDSYFAGHRYTREVSMLGRIANVRVCYWDFRTQGRVRAELEGMIPMCKVEIVERMFSDERKMSELMAMLDEDVNVIYNEGGGLFRKVPLCVAVEERLFTKDIL